MKNIVITIWTDLYGNTIRKIPATTPGSLEEYEAKRRKTKESKNFGNLMSSRKWIYKIDPPSKWKEKQINSIKY